MALSFTPTPLLPLSRRRPHHHPTACTPTAESALDQIPPSIKLNAVIQAVVTRNDIATTRRLLTELRAASLPLEPATLSAITDATLHTPSTLATLLHLSAPPGFRSATLPPPHPIPTHPPPDPTRPVELLSAASFFSIVSISLSAQILEPAVLHHPAPEATTVLTLLAVGLVWDRFGGNAAAAWDVIAAGFNRVLSRDPARAARAQAASFLVAYVLGLPWGAFRPDVGKVRRVVRAGCMGEGCEREVGVWMVAPAVVELETDGRLVEADLRQARAFLKGFVGKGGEIKEVQNRLDQAMDDARVLLTRYRVEHVQIADAMLRGASAGECMALLAEAFAK